MFSWEALFITKKKNTSYTQLFLCLESIDFKQKSLSDYLSMPFIVWYSTLKFQLLLARLESAYSLIWGSHKIWGKGGGDTLDLL